MLLWNSHWPIRGSLVGDVFCWFIIVEQLKHGVHAQAVMGSIASKRRWMTECRDWVSPTMVWRIWGHEHSQMPWLCTSTIRCSRFGYVTPLFRRIQTLTMTYWASTFLLWECQIVPFYCSIIIYLVVLSTFLFSQILRDVWLINHQPLLDGAIRL